MKVSQITPQFVEFIPENIAEGVIYISEKYATSIHKCACGCGREVVLPISPAKWQLRKSGSTVTLHPSIGNWDYPCGSHYWIRQNRIVWAGSMTARMIAQVKERDRIDQQRYIARKNQEKTAVPSVSDKTTPARQESLWSIVRKFFGL